MLITNATWAAASLGMAVTGMWLLCCKYSRLLPGTRLMAGAAVVGGLSSWTTSMFWSMARALAEPGERHAKFFSENRELLTITTVLVGLSVCVALWNVYSEKFSVRQWVGLCVSWFVFWIGITLIVDMVA